MADQFHVDLDELDKTVTSLNRILSTLGKTGQDAKHSTHLPHGALGDFPEAQGLYGAHAEMAVHIHDVVDYLNSVMDEFGQKTKKVHGNYQNSDSDAHKAFHDASKN